MPLVVADPLGLSVDVEGVGIEANEVHFACDIPQELLLTLYFLVVVVQGVLVLVNFHDDNAVLGLHDKVYTDVAPGVPIEPNRDLTLEINTLNLKAAFHALLMDLDSSTATAFLMPVATANGLETLATCVA